MLPDPAPHHAVRIAIVDDDPGEASHAASILAAAGYSCLIFPDPDSLLADPVCRQQMLLIVGSGFMDRVDKLLAAPDDRRQHAPPVLYLLGRGDEDGIADKLERGRADYLFRPIRRLDLVARVGILMRRSFPERVAMPVRFGSYAFDPERHSVSIGDKRTALTQKEFELALLLFRNIGRPLSRAYLMEAVWSRDADLPTRTVDTHISRVRTKLALHPERGFRLAPVYSYGYRLEQLDPEHRQTDRPEECERKPGPEPGDQATPGHGSARCKGDNDTGSPGSGETG